MAVKAGARVDDAVAEMDDAVDAIAENAAAAAEIVEASVVRAMAAGWRTRDHVVAGANAADGRCSRRICRRSAIC